MTLCKELVGNACSWTVYGQDHRGKIRATHVIAETEQQAIANATLMWGGTFRCISVEKGDKANGRIKA